MLETGQKEPAQKLTDALLDNYPGLDRGELVEWVERFYSEYYFRPKAVWRVVSSAVRNNDIPRLYKEAREYLFVSRGRKKFVKEQKEASAALRGAEGGAS